MSPKFAPRLIRASLLLTLVLGGGLAAGVASAEAIQCPKAEVTRKVIDPLPGGWWTTPIRNRLQSTRVVEIGGKPTLLCDYGSAGSVMRLPPAGTTCQAIHTGFNCVAAVAPGPRTYSTKALNIPQTWAADLDQGSVGGGGEDIWFQARTATQLFITPRNGAQVSISGSRNRGYNGCRSAAWTNQSLRLADVPVGTYVCVKTNQGRISEFRMNQISGGSPKTLRIGYTTWQ